MQLNDFILHLFFFFFNDTATTVIYTLSLHDALPIDLHDAGLEPQHRERILDELPQVDRKSTRLNSSHLVISYAVFCLKKKNQTKLRRTYEKLRTNFVRIVAIVWLK